MRNNSSRKSMQNIDGYTPRSVQRALTRSKQALVRLSDIEGYLGDVAKVVERVSDDEMIIKSAFECIHGAQRSIEMLYTRFAAKQTILANRQALNDVKAAENGTQS